MNVFTKIVNVIVFFIEAYKKYRAQKNSDDIRADSASHFLYKFGGEDERANSTAKPDKSDSDK